MVGFLSKEHIIAEPGFNRWRVPPASIAIHLCIGSVYAWSIYNPALIKAHGVVASAASDWTLKDVVWIFTMAIVFLGLSAAFAGRWLERVGPRMVGVVAACCWGRWPSRHCVNPRSTALFPIWSRGLIRPYFRRYLERVSTSSIRWSHKRPLRLPS